MKYLIALFIGSFLTTTACSSEKDEAKPTNKSTKTEMPTTKEQHLAKAQFYRWYQLYEREISDTRINNQMDILQKDVFIKSSAGEMKGSEKYPERVKAFVGWKNAHHVQNIAVGKAENGDLKLEADIHYQNIQPDGKKSSYAVHYTTELEKSENLLPKFAYIEIAPTGATNHEFKDAYPNNRLKSLMHYWLALMENLDPDVSPFRELLAKDFELNFSTTSKITSMAELEAWMKGIPSQLERSEHVAENFAVREILKNEYELTVEFDWKGLTKDGKKMVGRTKHTWYVVDNINDRFAKVLRVDVTQIEPLKVVE